MTRREVSPIELSAAQMLAVEAYYATPPRAYHNFAHVGEVLRHYHDVAAGPGWDQTVEVWLAALYHDAIYEPPHADNEERSAKLAVTEIARWLPDASIDAQRVSELILLTARHGRLQPGDVDADAALFLDCDMAVLAAPEDVFDAYDRAIAAEYSAHVPAAVFREGRARFLRGLLEQDRIFLSAHFHARCDTRARENLERALKAWAA